MLGWLIFFAVATGIFLGATGVVGIAIVMSGDSKTKDNLRAHDEALELANEDRPPSGPILT